MILVSALYYDFIVAIFSTKHFPGNTMVYRAVLKTPFLLFVCFASFIVLSACDQNSDVSQMSTAAPAIDESKVPVWLDARVGMTPQHWLVKRSLAEVMDEEAEVERARKLLIIAANKFKESPRMIANRVAQLEDMLLENNINETAVNLLEWFTNLPDVQTPHNFSALCEYYYNLRIQGKTEDEIINEIMGVK